VSQHHDLTSPQNDLVTKTERRSADDASLIPVQRNILLEILVHIPELLLELWHAGHEKHKSMEDRWREDIVRRDQSRRDALASAITEGIEAYGNDQQADSVLYDAAHVETIRAQLNRIDDICHDADVWLLDHWRPYRDEPPSKFQDITVKQMPITRVYIPYWVGSGYGAEFSKANDLITMAIHSGHVGRREGPDLPRHPRTRSFVDDAQVRRVFFNQVSPDIGHEFVMSSPAALLPGGTPPSQSAAPRVQGPARTPGVQGL
jgi:hypothetical protein